MQQQNNFLRRRGKILTLSAAVVAAILIFRRPLFQLAALILGATVLSFFTTPLAALFERKLSRPISALLSLLSVALVLTGAAWLILPIMIREITELFRLLPHGVSMISDVFNRVSGWISRHLNIASLPQQILGSANYPLGEIATDTIALAGGIADIVGKISLTIVLCYFFLCDRDMLLLKTELLIPQKYRATAVHMGHAVLREMRMYIRSQITIALSVAILSTIGLLILRVRSAIALGPIIGLFNMIPYFGPFIGGVPAVLIALADSWQKAGLTILAIIIVQQLDNNFISPRIMGNLTGMSPAIVLIAIFTGSKIAGVVGMLFALPVIMTFRTLFRVFVQRHENI